MRLKEPQHPQSPKRFHYFFNPIQILWKKKEKIKLVSISMKNGTHRVVLLAFDWPLSFIFLFFIELFPWIIIKLHVSIGIWGRNK